MKDQPSEPSIQTAKEIATKFNKEIVLVITLEKGGRLQVHSYGQDRAACAAAGRMAEACFSLIVKSVPSRVRAIFERTYFHH